MVSSVPEFDPISSSVEGLMAREQLLELRLAGLPRDRILVSAALMEEDLTQEPIQKGILHCLVRLEKVEQAGSLTTKSISNLSKEHSLATSSLVAKSSMIVHP